MAAFAYHTAHRDASVQQSAAVSPEIMLKEKFMDFRVPEVHSVQFRGLKCTVSENGHIFHFH